MLSSSSTMTMGRSDTARTSTAPHRRFRSERLRAAGRRGDGTASRTRRRVAGLAPGAGVPGVPPRGWRATRGGPGPPRARSPLDGRVHRGRRAGVGGDARHPLPVIIVLHVAVEPGVADGERALPALVVAGEEDGRAEGAGVVVRDLRAA